jgi:hypothetical protein
MPIDWVKKMGAWEGEGKGVSHPSVRLSASVYQNEDQRDKGKAWAWRVFQLANGHHEQRGFSPTEEAAKAHAEDVAEYVAELTEPPKFVYRN